MYGTPVIGANIGGIPELIAEGETGELFESGNADNLKEKIETLWKDAEKQALYCRNCLNTDFADISEYGNELLKLYSRT